MAYATPEDIASFLSVEQAALPDDVERLIDRASEQVDYVSLGRIDPIDDVHAEAARQATCAQVEFYIQAGEQRELSGDVTSYSIGRLSIRRADSGSGKAGPLAPRARQYLLLAGLLSRGVRAV